MNIRLILSSIFITSLFGCQSDEICRRVAEHFNSLGRDRYSCTHINSIGNGATATTFELEDTEGRHYVAKRSPYPEDTSSNKYKKKRRNFRKEVEILKAVKGPHVIRLVEFLDLETEGLELLEFANDGTLAKYFISLTREERSVSAILGMFRQLLRGVKDIHDLGWIHSDLKEENVVVSDGTLKIIDFDVAHREGTTDVSAGTITHADPLCLIDGTCFYDEFVDVHALGVILFWMTTGGVGLFAKVPLDKIGEKAISGKYEIPWAIHWLLGFLIQACLTIDAEQRPTIQGLLDVVNFYLRPGIEIPNFKLQTQTIDAYEPADLQKLKILPSFRRQPPLPRMRMVGNRIEFDMREIRTEVAQKPDVYPKFLDEVYDPEELRGEMDLLINENQPSEVNQQHREQDNERTLEKREPSLHKKRPQIQKRKPVMQDFAQLRPGSISKDEKRSSSVNVPRDESNLMKTKTFSRSPPVLVQLRSPSVGPVKAKDPLPEKPKKSLVRKSSSKHGQLNASLFEKRKSNPYEMVILGNSIPVSPSNGPQNQKKVERIPTLQKEGANRNEGILKKKKPTFEQISMFKRQEPKRQLQASRPNLASSPTHLISGWGLNLLIVAALLLILGQGVKGWLRVASRRQSPKESPETTAKNFTVVSTIFSNSNSPF